MDDFLSRLARSALAPAPQVRPLFPADLKEQKRKLMTMLGTAVTNLHPVDKIVPVDMYVPGCPPRPEQLMEGIIRLHEAVQAGVPPAYELRAVAT